VKDQYLEEQFIGKTFTDKLNDEIADYLSERKFKVLGYLPRPGAVAMVHTLKDGEIKSLGGSEPHDVINDNFGKWLAALHSPYTSNINLAVARIGQGIDPVDIAGVGQGSVFFYNSLLVSFNGGGTGGITSMQIGEGVGSPSVSDFNIETGFSNGGPEDNRINTGNGGYAPTLARVSVAANIGPTVGSGTINELGLYQAWTQGGSPGIFMLSHDAISPGVAFTGGEIIFTQYFFQL
jgi:hypothetical protein